MPIKRDFWKMAVPWNPCPHPAFGPIVPAATLKSVGRFYSRAKLLVERQRWKREGKTACSVTFLIGSRSAGLSRRNAVAVVQPGKRFYRPSRFLLGDAQFVKAL